ncbi:MAG: hypothetical protein HY560_14615 [Gemmatimonadetes bacterium]|nr:hypothetical protein [Gemmatimonadota bacterium]
MIARAPSFWVLVLLLACGGGDGAAPLAAPPGQLATAPEGAGGQAPAAAGGGTAGSAPLAAEQAPTDSTSLQREVFSYRAGGRDPFLSLMRSADVRPLVTDLRVVGITYDPAYPARSVAVLRDIDQNKRYAVRVGDELGRIKVTEIRPDAVVVSIEEFGSERQVVLAVRKRQEENP